MLEARNLQVVQLSWLCSFLSVLDQETNTKLQRGACKEGWWSEMTPPELGWCRGSRRNLCWAQSRAEHEGLSSQASLDVAEKHL